MSTTVLLPSYRLVSGILQEHDYVTRVVVIRNGQVVDVQDDGVKDGERPHVWFLHKPCGSFAPSVIQHQSACDQALKLDAMETEALRAYMS